MKETWYFTVAPLCVDKLKPGSSLDNGPGYPTFCKARMALIERLQADARIYRGWAEENLRRVLEVAHLKEPS